MSTFRQCVVLPFLAICLSCAVGILFVELALRVVDYSRPPFYRYDVEIGTSLRPNTEGWMESEDLIKIRINSNGLRGPDVPINKPPGVFRVAVLGDSYAAGFQVTFDQRFSKVMEDAFNAERCRGDARIEVLNFGVSGYGQAREILMFRHRVIAFKPDLVLLQFTGGNDFRNNTKEMERNPLIPYFVFDGDRLVLDRSGLDSAAFAHKVRWSNFRNDVVNHVRVLQVLQDYYIRTVIEPEMAAAEAAGVDPGVTNMPALGVAPPEGEMGRKAWRLTEEHLRLLAQEVRAATGRPLWVMNVPPQLAVLHDARARHQQLDALGLPDADYVEHRLGEFFRTEGITFVPLTAPLRSYAERNGINLHHFDYRGGQDGHWNAHGHGEAGRAIAAAMCPALAAR